MNKFLVSLTLLSSSVAFASDFLPGEVLFRCALSPEQAFVMTKAEGSKMVSVSGLGDLQMFEAGLVQNANFESVYTFSFKNAVGKRQYAKIILNDVFQPKTIKLTGLQNLAETACVLAAGDADLAVEFPVRLDALIGEASECEPMFPCVD